MDREPTQIIIDTLEDLPALKELIFEEKFWSKKLVRVCGRRGIKLVDWWA